MRPKHTPLEDHPGTVGHDARGYCSTCYADAPPADEWPLPWNPADRLTEEEGRQALCSQVDPDLHFPEKGQWTQTQRAKRVCNGDPKRGIEPCPIRMRCLEVALANHEVGIWGGTTEAERSAIRRGEKIA